MVAVTQRRQSGCSRSEDLESATSCMISGLSSLSSLDNSSVRSRRDLNRDHMKCCLDLAPLITFHRGLRIKAIDNILLPVY